LTKKNDRLMDEYRYCKVILHRHLITSLQFTTE